MNTPPLPNNNSNKEDVVSVKAPGGFEATFRGRYLPNLLRFMVFLALALILVLGYRFQIDSREEHYALRTAIEAQTSAQIETTYVLTLKQEAREALNLAIPDSLRKRTRP